MATANNGFHCIADFHTSASYTGFISSMNVWINRPNVINKRIHCAIVRSTSTDSTNTCTILNRQLIPKSDHYKPGNDTIHIDGSNQCVTFTPSIPHADYASYQFKYITDTSISLLLQVGECSVPLEEGVAIHPTKEWLRYSLLPKICKWAEGEEQDGATPTSSLGSLVPSERFCLLYKELKQKYGPTLVKNWTETTDPYKFVYEDIAIATYLLILWEEERGRHGLECKQSFVDLGCGNGLLVFILSCEGHRGKGIDLRERRIWSILRPTAHLEVSAITPSSSSQFPDFDWLIGNHSDELTPWIPVMAARSSYNTRYFVLPCCSYDFDKKFCRPTSSQSQYTCYLEYIELIGTNMGFNVQRDILRIPSSKRVCLIGQSRSYPPSNEDVIETKRCLFIQSRCTGGGHHPTTITVGAVSHDGHMTDDDDDVTVWAENFKPRPSQELVKNCSRVDPLVQEKIVAMVTSALLDHPSPHWMELHGPTGTRYWNKGGQLSIVQVVEMLDRDILSCLKDEYGGIHTFLRNHCQIFQVHKGIVELRDWSRLDSPQVSHKSRVWRQKQSDLLYKTKLCWFNDSHPQGCPRTSINCPYAHGHVDLRQRPNFDTLKKATRPIFTE